MAGAMRARGLSGNNALLRFSHGTKAEMTRAQVYLLWLARRRPIARAKVGCAKIRAALYDLAGDCPAAALTCSKLGPLGLVAGLRGWPGTYQSFVHSQTLPIMS